MEFSFLVKIFLGTLAAWNSIVFLVYGFDKLAAKKGWSRVPEKTLIWLAVAFGSVGAALGMYLFHHKTLKKKFSIGLPLILFAHIGIAWLLLYLINMR